MLQIVLPNTYQQILYLVLALADGILFGLAIKKGILAFIIFIIATLLATYIGISLPGLSFTTFISKGVTLLMYVESKIPTLVAGVPIVFLVGLAIGLWKG